MGTEIELNPVKMFSDALRWNMLNLVRVELFFNCYKLWDIFVHSSLKSPIGHYAIASFVITFFAQLTIQFNLTWFMSIYTIYLAVGVCSWIYRRVWFYHRKLNRQQVFGLLRQMEIQQADGIGAHQSGEPSDTMAGSGKTATLKPSKSHHQSGTTASSSSSNSSSSDNTNSLQRQRCAAYQSFLLTQPRLTHKEFALSLAHLSHIAKLAASEEVYDEMHFQLLTTRRDVVNIILRLILLAVGTLLANM